MRFLIPIPKQRMAAPLKVRIIQRMGLGLMGLMTVCVVQAIHIVQTPLTEPAPLLGTSALETSGARANFDILPGVDTASQQSA